MEEENTELLDAQTEDQDEEQDEEQQQLTPEEIQELKRKAEVSSQNFERAKKAEEAKRALEKELEELRSTQFEDPEDPVQRKLHEIEQKIASLAGEKEFESIITKYPVIKDKIDDFNTFKIDYPGVKLENIAKLFLAEHDLLTEPIKRKGLEKAGGGQRVIPKAGKMSAEDVKRLREENFKEYTKLVRSGKIQLT